jgi:hypothetical protein
MPRIMRPLRLFADNMVAKAIKKLEQLEHLNI